MVTVDDDDMVTVDSDDTFTELADQERRRKERRRSSTPLVRFVLALVGIVVVVVVGTLLIRGWLHSREASAYSSYVTQVQSILKSSDAMGAELTLLLTKPGDSTRKDVQTKLDQYRENSEKLTTKAKALSSPSDLKEAQQWFVAIMQLRSKGLERLKPSLMTALDVQDVEVSSDQIARAMQLLVLSDVAYEEFFVARAREVLQEKDLKGVNVPSAKFINDPDVASQVKVKEILSDLKSSGNIQATHGVAIGKVTALPAAKDIAPGGSYNLQSTDDLTFTAEVENQGNMAEKDVPVTLTLNSPDTSQPQIVTVKIDELKPKEHKKVTLTGVNATAYGEVALLKVEVGPVPGEKIKENNVLEAQVTFIL